MFLDRDVGLGESKVVLVLNPRVYTSIACGGGV